MTARLVETLSKVASVGLDRYALAGGLAVTCRLAQVHRATGDIDTLVETTDPDALDLLARQLGPLDERHKLVIDGVKVDVLPTEPLDELRIDGITVPDLLFVVGHRYALESATAATIVVVDDHSEALASVTCPVATPAGLVACKLHALEDRPRTSQAKRATDLYDLYLLVGDYHTAVISDLAEAPLGLGRLVAEGLETAVLSNLAGAHHQLTLHPDDRVNSITENQLAGRFVPLVTALKS